MHEGFVDDDVHSESGTLTMGSRLVVSLISKLSGPFTFENITTPSDSDE
jgi:hypothetical protein